jgi:lysophospholipase L1-like esterase
MTKIVLLGDSIRMRYQPLVQKGLAEAVVWGPAQNCETSEKILAHLDDWVFAHRPDVVHLNCGLHDLRYNPGAERRMVSPIAYVRNLEAIMAQLTSRTDARIVWATITPVDQARHQAHKRSRRYESDVTLYNRLALETVSRYGAQVNDLFGTVVSYGKDRIIQKDGVHFTDEGYALLSRRVIQALRSVTGTAASLHPRLP